MERDPEQPPNCQRCGGGTHCTRTGTAITTLPLKVGYYRISPHSLDVRRCPDAVLNCTSGSGVYGLCAQSTSACRGGQSSEPSVSLPNDTASCDAIVSTSNNQCDEGLMGPFCQLCDDKNASFGNRRYYRPAWETRRASCRGCLELLHSREVWQTALVVFGILALVGIVALFVHRRYQAALADWKRYFLALGIPVKLKHVYGFYVIMTRIEGIYHIQLPVEIKAAMDYFYAIFSFGSDMQGIPKECFGITTHLDRLQFWMTLPVIAIVVVVVVILTKLVVKRTISFEAVIANCLPPVMTLLFLAYPMVTNVAFESFSCYRFTVVEPLSDALTGQPISEGKTCYYMMTDPATECVSEFVPSDEVWSTALLAVLLYPVGVWCLTAALLFQARKDILAKRVTPLSTALSFLHHDLQPAFCWWELVEMIRRLVLIGFLVVVEPGSLIQLVLGTTFAFLFFALQMQAMPYKLKSVAYLAMASSGALTAFFILCTYFKFESLTDTVEIQEIMTPAQRRLYSPPQLFLTVLSMGSLFGTIIIGVGVSVANAHLDRKLVRKTRDRRLRYSGTHGREVEAPSLLPGHYHLFMSSGKEQGAEVVHIIKTRIVEMIPHFHAFGDADDLKENDGTSLKSLDASSVFLAFCTSEFFASRACARELIRAVLLRKPICLLLEPDSTHARGGLTEAHVMRILMHDRFAPYDLPTALATCSWADRWGLENEILQWSYEGKFAPPQVSVSDLLATALFESRVVEWHRGTVGNRALQHVTMRLIAEHVLSVCMPATMARLHARAKQLERARGNIEPVIPKTFMKVEATEQEIDLAPFAEGRRFHLYCSPHNLGALALGRQLEHFVRLRSSPSTWVGTGVRLTSDLGALDECEHMLIYLTAHTWANGEASGAFAGEVCEAQRRGVHLLLVHEAPTNLSEDHSRDSCAFDWFLTNDCTPRHLLEGEANLFRQESIGLLCGQWRLVGLAKVATALAAGGGHRDRWKAHPDEPEKPHPPQPSYSMRQHTDVLDDMGTVDVEVETVRLPTKPPSARVTRALAALPASLPPGEPSPHPAAAHSEVEPQSVRTRQDALDELMTNGNLHFALSDSD